MTRPARRCVGRPGGCPTIGAGIVSAAGVKTAVLDIYSAPDDHFTADPYSRGSVSLRGRVGRAGGCPTVRAGIVSATGVEIAADTMPPQTIISLPVQIAACPNRAVRALTVVVAVHVSMHGGSPASAILGRV